MDILYKPPFRRFVKKQSRAFQLVVEDEVERIINDPDFGEIKKGDLKGVKVYKFKFQRQQYLLAYKVERDRTIFYMIDDHENFYRKLKQYLREVE